MKKKMPGWGFLIIGVSVLLIIIVIVLVMTSMNPSDKNSDSHATTDYVSDNGKEVSEEENTSTIVNGIDLSSYGYNPDEVEAGGNESIGTYLYPKGFSDYVGAEASMMSECEGRSSASGMSLFSCGKTYGGANATTPEDYLAGVHEEALNNETVAIDDSLTIVQNLDLNGCDGYILGMYVPEDDIWMHTWVFTNGYNSDIYLITVQSDSQYPELWALVFSSYRTDGSTVIEK